MNEQYLDLFVDESSQHLQEMTSGLMALEGGTDNPDLIQTVFRAAHTLKGMAATMGFERMSQLTHQMENGLDSMRHGQLEPTSQVVDALFACVDVLESQLQAIIETGSDSGVDESAALAALKSVLSGSQSGLSDAASVTDARMTETIEVSPVEVPKESAALSEQGVPDEEATGQQVDTAWWSGLKGGIEAVAESGARVFNVLVTMVPDCPMPAVRAFMILRAVGDVGELLASEPSVEMIQSGECEQELRFVIAGSLQAADITVHVKGMLDVADVHVEELRFHSQAAATLSTGQARIDVLDSAGDMHPGDEGHRAKVPEAGPKAAKTGTGREALGPSSGTSARRSNHTIRVDLDKLDALMNLFSEFVIDKTRLESIAQKLANIELAETVSHLGRIGSSLQEVILNVRMVPVETIFNRFPRMVRDLAKSLSKQVKLEIVGEETELDRTLADEIGDPLVHLIRNALDHGLESPQEREQAGKPVVGELRLTAYQASNKVHIEISDDGRGIDRHRVLTKAVQSGLISEDAADTLGDDQVYNLLFQSGFSTADQISDISGRGVGLDVVKSKIQSLGGNVRVESSRGKGSRFLIELPLTLSIMQAMLVRVGSETCAVPLGDIAHMLRVPSSETRRVHDRDMILFTDKLIPLVRLPVVFGAHPGLEKTEVASVDIGAPILILRQADRMAALEVTEFLGQQEIVIKSLGQYFKTLPTGISGATILGDGRVALILDTQTWLR